ncbi:gap junction delta-4 protein [Patagioenas fasciata monilis]|uniref:Gap junction delta-4 protein n=1 Tax=Patagioenas fasciata monilis TaxID=372326 RepID=A0A1V4KLM1_PATFA|nr:gap junction delta-4 protein [Patagioenas fasciata monilis]
MERWDSLGFLIVTLNYNVTIVGKIWLMLIILLRMAVVVLAGYPLYQDEQERFVCNTLQPGCSNVCYDLFSPVSHFRFWLVQTVSILLPDAAFTIYVLHKAAILADLVCALRRMTARNQKNKLLANPHVEDECVLNLPPVQHGSSSPPQNQDCPISNSSQTTDGSCSLLSEEEEEAVLHPEAVSQQTASTNLNSNSNKPCISGDLAVEQDSTEEPLCAGDHQGTACERARPELQQDFIKDTALTLRPQIKSDLGVSSSVVQSKLLGYYPSAELKSPDAQSNYSSTSCLRSKKSEWV